jgi:hypothetical protein
MQKIPEKNMQRNIERRKRKEGFKSRGLKKRTVILAAREEEVKKGKEVF